MGMAYRFGEEEVMVFGLHAEVLENRVRPEALHVVPVLDLSVANGVVHTVSGATASSQSLITDEKVQVLGTTLSRQV